MVSQADATWSRTLYLRTLLKQAATINRAALTGEDPEGNPTYGAPAVHIDSTPCRWWITGEEEVVTPEQTVILKRYHFEFAHGADITEGDTITDVRDLAGVVQIDGPLDIQMAYDVHQFRIVQAEG